MELTINLTESEASALVDFLEWSVGQAEEEMDAVWEFERGANAPKSEWGPNLERLKSFKAAALSLRTQAMACAEGSAEVTPITGSYACNQCGYRMPVADEHVLLSTGEGDDSCECGGTFVKTEGGE